MHKKTSLAKAGGVVVPRRMKWCATYCFTKTGQRYSFGDSVLAALLLIDMNGPDIEAVEEVKVLILEYAHSWNKYKKRMPSRRSSGATQPSSNTQCSSKVFSQLSGLEDVVFNG